VNAWLIAATALLAGLVPCLLVCLRAPIMDALVALELAAVVVTLTLLLLAEGFARSSYYTLPLVLSALGFAGSLVFVRLLDRWL
jgi:multisubunit Na+/H+ antiporter MnhF subunit